MTTDRDQSIERLLRQARPTDSPPTVDACPDAETLAALADDALPAALRREVEGHIADCYHCQALTAAIARADAPVGAPAEAASDMPAWRRRALNWFVPAAAAATAVALWVLVPGQNTPPPTEPISERQVAETASPPLPPPSSEVVTSEPLQLPDDMRADEQTRDRNAALEAGRARVATPPAAAAAAAAPPPPVPAAPGEPLRKAESLVVGGVAATPEVSASAPVSANRAADQGRGAGAERRNEGALNESVAVQQEQALSRQLRAAASFEVVSPNPRIRWRVGPGAIVQYSADGGMTWATQQAGATVELTGGSSPAAEVCWLVGRGGLVLRTTSAGRRWQRLTFPENVDLTAITASNARNATAVLTDGRQFATGDGGMTWNPVR